jgi:hypothetical protein
MPTWEQLRTGVYEIDGTWRDIYVLDPSRENWRQWMRCVNQNYPVRWGVIGYQDDQTVDVIDVDHIDRLWDAGEISLNTWCTVFLEKVEVKCHFFSPLEIEQDVDPSQISSVADHERLMAYLITISRALQQEVIMTAENNQALVYIRVNGANIEYV